MLRPLAAATVAACALAAPAGAVSGGYGASTALHQGKVLVITRTTERDQHSCQAHTSSRTSRRFAPVACEQPPKSLPNLAQTASAALTILG
jgi:hypothetical protein